MKVLYVISFSALCGDLGELERDHSFGPNCCAREQSLTTGNPERAPRASDRDYDLSNDPSLNEWLKS